MSVDFLSKNFPPFQVHHAKKPPRFYPDGFQRNVIDFYFIFSDCRLRKALYLQFSYFIWPLCKYAIVESALVIPSKFTYFMIKPAFGSCYGLIKYKWFSKLQFKSLRIKQHLFDNYYKDTCAITKGDMIAFLQENSLYSLKDGIEESEAIVHIFVGEKENHSMKKSAELIHKKLQNSSIQVLPNMYHGEFSINHADDYVRKLLEIVKRR